MIWADFEIKMPLRACHSILAEGISEVKFDFPQVYPAEKSSLFFVMISYLEHLNIIYFYEK